MHDVECVSCVIYWHWCMLCSMKGKPHLEDPDVLVSEAEDHHHAPINSLGTYSVSHVSLLRTRMNFSCALFCIRPPSNKSRLEDTRYKRNMAEVQNLCPVEVHVNKGYYKTMSQRQGFLKASISGPRPSKWPEVIWCSFEK